MTLNLRKFDLFVEEIDERVLIAIEVVIAAIANWNVMTVITSFCHFFTGLRLHGLGLFILRGASGSLNKSRDKLYRASLI